ncbi:hypothetical protein I6F35_31985 [Bradyrhizobium sp. BRP22]|uniref:hypothetical protein n=1 Tax=Bradyrhizobium sp. BRP22 TaxID=2793821 RepID=UPI001CD21630|nr:hypothetical protein [Bradyrhizobium sp. BRP22]MCA1457752.1 hypothetical protein [Bradyrhizobium sp. BRP22]
MLDNRNDYSFAGPGAKRRRVRLEEIPQKIERSKHWRPYQGAPKSEKRKEKELKKSEQYENARGVVERIRALVLDHDLSALDIEAQLKRDGYPATVIMISSVRSHMIQSIKLLIDAGLIDRRDLKRHRSRMKSRR